MGQLLRQMHTSRWPDVPLVITAEVVSLKNRFPSVHSVCCTSRPSQTHCFFLPFKMTQNGHNGYNYKPKLFIRGRADCHTTSPGPGPTTRSRNGALGRQRREGGRSYGEKGKERGRNVRNEWQVPAGPRSGGSSTSTQGSRGQTRKK